MMGVQAQIHEVGVFLGGSNYIGDIGRTDYITPNEPALGLLYKWNKSPRHSFRISYIQSDITANDLDSKESSRNSRGNRIKTNLYEVSLGLEFNFFDFNLHDSSPKITPYVASGISYFFAKYTLINDALSTSFTDKIARGNSLAVPMIIGIKSNITPHFILAIETGARYTLSDNLDGSLDQNLGNLNNNDWFVFSGVTLTYTFGQKPCYCSQ
jgi:hypothetical protein